MSTYAPSAMFLPPTPTPLPSGTNLISKEKYTALTLASPELKKPLLRLGSPLILPDGYEAVVFTGLSSVMFLTWKSLKVAEARKEYKIPNPLTYSENNTTFNCVQRALQSTLQIYPQFLFLLLIGGLEMPYFSSLGGLIWILGRYVYARGYYTGDPRNRANGAFYFVGHCMLLVSTLRFALRRLYSYADPPTPDA